MASSKNILLKEYKDLAKEKWVTIDVSQRHISAILEGIY
jgi:hypothetical protein